MAIHALDKKTGSLGYTLAELMIVVAILGIIFVIAVPNFQQRAIVSKRTDATSALLAIAAAQERFYLKNNTYTNDLESLSLKNTEAKLYDLSLEEAGNGGFIATATAADGGSQALDSKCLSFSIDHTGLKTSTGTSDTQTTECW